MAFFDGFLLGGGPTYKSWDDNLQVGFKPSKMVKKLRVENKNPAFFLCNAGWKWDLSM